MFSLFITAALKLIKFLFITACTLYYIQVEAPGAQAVDGIIQIFLSELSQLDWIKIINELTVELKNIFDSFSQYMSDEFL